MRTALGMQLFSKFEPDLVQFFFWGGTKRDVHSLSGTWHYNTNKHQETKEIGATLCGSSSTSDPKLSCYTSPLRIPGYIFTWGGSSIGARCPLDLHQAARLETDFAPGSDISGSKIAAAAEFVSWLWQTEHPKKPYRTIPNPVVTQETQFHHDPWYFDTSVRKGSDFPPKNPQPVGTHMKDISQWLMEDTFFFDFCCVFWYM